MARANSRSADCHPDKPHYAKGLCQWCYVQQRWAVDPAGTEGERLRLKAAQKAWRKANKGHERAAHLQHSYGLTPDDVAAMMDRQGGRCAICLNVITGMGGKYTRARVDHCHETGAVRGLLCHSCNLGLGMLGDTVEAIERALAYLKAT